MVEPEVAEDIDRTLGVARTDVERLIADLRLLAFTLALCISSAFQLVGVAQWQAPAYVAACAVYAGIMRWLVRRFGAPTFLSVTATVLDLTLFGAWFVIAPPGDSPEERATLARLGLTPVIIAMLTINLLRANSITAVIGPLAAVPLVMMVLVPLHGFSSVLIFPCAVVLSLLVVGVTSARRTRQTLALYARLRLLRRFVPAPLVDRVLHRPDLAAPWVGGELRTVTLLASDLRGFTALSETLPPTEVVRQLNAYHGAMLAVVKRYGGTLDKFIGDGMLVVFGLERATDGEGDAGAEAAVECARAMVAELEGHNAQRQAQGLAALAAGIGIHTGSTVMGSIGAPGHRLEFTVIGDAVNTAARLESLTKEVGHPVLVSAETAQRLPSRADLVQLAPLSARGKRRPLEVYALSTRCISAARQRTSS